MAMGLIAEAGNYRAITRAPATEGGDTVFVQRLNGGEWQDVRSFNARSDDYAYTNAREDVERRARQDARPSPREYT